MRENILTDFNAVPEYFVLLCECRSLITEAFYIFIKSCYKRPSFQSYIKMTIVRETRFNEFYSDYGHFIV